MASETTELAPQPVDSAQRSSYMKALSLAEQIMSETSALPTNFIVAVPHYAPDQPGICFYFHHDLAGLRQFRDDQWLSETREDRDNGWVYFEVKGAALGGVSVSAWTLLDAEEAAAVSS